MDDVQHPIPLDREALAPRRRLRVAAAVVWDGDRLLLTQRPPGGAHALQWELPGGKIEPGESPEQALTRELREELGVAARALAVLEVARHEYPDGLAVEVTFIRCALESHAFVPSHAVHAARWVEPAAIALGEVLAADRDFLTHLGARSATRPHS